MFSCTDSFIASYFLNTLLKSGSTLNTTKTRMLPSTGTSARKIHASVVLMVNAMTKENISMMGERTATRMIIINAICTLVTSVVIRVTRLDVENLSMFAKEKSCTE